MREIEGSLRRNVRRAELGDGIGKENPIPRRGFQQGKSGRHLGQDEDQGGELGQEG